MNMPLRCSARLLFPLLFAGPISSCSVSAQHKDVLQSAAEYFVSNQSPVDDERRSPRVRIDPRPLPTVWFKHEGQFIGFSDQNEQIENQAEREFDIGSRWALPGRAEEVIDCEKIETCRFIGGAKLYLALSEPLIKGDRAYVRVLTQYLGERSGRPALEASISTLTLRLVGEEWKVTNRHISLIS